MKKEKSYFNFVEVSYKIFGIYECFYKMHKIYEDSFQKDKTLSGAPPEVNFFYDTSSNFLKNTSSINFELEIGDAFYIVIGEVKERARQHYNKSKEFLDIADKILQELIYDIENNGITTSKDDFGIARIENKNLDEWQKKLFSNINDNEVLFNSERLTKDELETYRNLFNNKYNIDIKPIHDAVRIAEHIKQRITLAQKLETSRKERNHHFDLKRNELQPITKDNIDEYNQIERVEKINEKGIEWLETYINIKKEQYFEANVGVIVWEQQPIKLNKKHKKNYLPEEKFDKQASSKPSEEKQINTKKNNTPKRKKTKLNSKQLSDLELFTSRCKKGAKKSGGKLQFNPKSMHCSYKMLHAAIVKRIEDYPSFIVRGGNSMKYKTFHRYFIDTWEGMEKENKPYGLTDSRDYDDKYFNLLLDSYERNKGFLE